MMFESEESEEGQGLLFECHLQTSNCGPIVSLIVSKAASPQDFCIAGDSDALDLLFSNLCLFVCCNCFQIYLHLQIMLRSGSARNGPLFASDATTAECFTTKALASLSRGH